MKEEARRVLLEYREMAQHDVGEVVEQIRYANQQSGDDVLAAADQIRSALDDLDDLVIKYRNV